MARGGRRQGQPGRSYSNRKDLNVERAPQPGSSATLPPQGQVQEQGGMLQAAQAHISPDSFPNLTDPTNYPDVPVSSGVNGGPGDPMGPMQVAQGWNQAFAEALAVFPGDPDLLRIARYIKNRGGL